MKILLLGPNGQLGFDLQKIAKNEKVEIVPVGRDRLDLLRTERIQPVLEDLAFDVLVNAASDNRVDDAETVSKEAFAVNARAVERIALACRNRRARLIHISTDYVFDGTKGVPYRETDRPAPLNVYGSSKLAGETAALSLHEDSVVLRTASLFGVAGSSGKGGNFVETIVRMARENKPLTVVDDTRMSPTGTEDLARLILEVVRKGPITGIYHAVNAGSATWYGFARAILERLKIPVEIRAVTSEDYSRKARRPRFSVLDTSKLEAVVGKIPPWEASLDRYLKAKGYL